MAKSTRPKTGKYHVPTTTLNTQALAADIRKDFEVLVKKYTDEGVPRQDVYDIIRTWTTFE